ncbi:hypothetical protein [Roseomonas xinghualingensis]|uniref:hypothetical protein n=1 Tax=Roseomonas xinghualingensis TaxID=2986475 RepID=UPI0021F1CE2F|nr:hypothetical protein [Roseomonas sp. SXEYE001]MCV4209872.1 hypothetical protein [Roseomonas sp. SXEYE001]
MMLIRPPFEVQQRAWEAAHVLRADFADRLLIEDRVRIEEVYLVGPEALGWADVKTMLRCARLTIGERS